MSARPPSVSYTTTTQANQSGNPREAKYFPTPAIPNTMALRYRPCRMNRAPMLTRSSNAPYGALSASIIFSSFLLGVDENRAFQPGGRAMRAASRRRAFSRMRMRFFGFADKADRAKSTERAGFPPPRYFG